jgi:hypothetical protein
MVSEPVDLSNETMNMVKFRVKVVDVSVRLMGGPVSEETTEGGGGDEGAPAA